MGTCNIDHSLADVQKKLESQKPFLPEQLAASLSVNVKGNQTQEELNDIFHLLKKYDLATKEEQDERNKKLENYIK